MTSERENNKKLKEFFSEEYHSLTAYVNSKIRASVNRDAEDIIQDVALKLFSGADRYSPINNVAGFVYRSVKNKIIDVMRQQRKPDNAVTDYENKLIEFTELFYGKPDNSYSEEIKRELKKNILGLKPNYRDVIRAIDFEGYTYRELSIETGIPEGTLMSRRHRAISMLYKKLESKKEDH
ncbi:RNA polymerase sigma factor [Galbibacter sp. EGI 63066]|uniref:RNA polymerase sigma factor n=1 Tax=Galbibacter sp. EGI 63066 TaxID=2993559 RepID=UPI002248E848|nr:RNA polymerase sigma factor [Galbibacter sp. EGI 63066]MCX2681615.1 RNA polymerase sigma factor [Galbibacter sp. EGI 63066]